MMMVVVLHSEVGVKIEVCVLVAVDQDKDQLTDLSIAFCSSYPILINWSPF